MSDQITVYIDDIVSMFTEGDFEPQQLRLREGVVFAWEIARVSVRQAKDGYLMLSLKLEAKDGDNRTMGVQWENIALPVSYKGAAPGDWAKRMFISKLRPFFPEHAAYDQKMVDPATGKTVYLKAGEVVNYAQAKKQMQKTFAAKAIELAKEFAAEGEEVDVLPELVGNLVYGGVASTTKGDRTYTNLIGLSSQPPVDTEVVYDRAIALA